MAHHLDGDKRWRTAALLIALIFTGPVAAEPYRPSDEGAIVEWLPRSVAGERAALRAMRKRLAQDPEDLPLALDVADRYIDLGRVESDPRMFGYAEGVMQPWLNAADPPVAVLVARATLKQQRHDFAAARADLARAIERDPRNARAWLTLATIERVQGHYAAAKDACGRLSRLAPLLIAMTCAADVRGLGGHGSAAYAGLRAIFLSRGESSPEIRIWALTVLAELAARAGDTAAAEMHYREALAVGRRDAYLLAAYADFLFDRQRPADVVRLLADETATDPLLLRLAMAERMLGDGGWLRKKDMLADRFAANRARGERSHLREEARFALSLADDPATALRLAGENWQDQREPADARLVLEAAIAAGAPTATADVLSWLELSGLDDPPLAHLARRIAEMPT
jgi:tetratricopeptide (TPR) repeat protein